MPRNLKIVKDANITYSITAGRNMVHIIRFMQGIVSAMFQQGSVKERHTLHQKIHVYVLKKKLYKGDV